MTFEQRLEKVIHEERAFRGVCLESWRNNNEASVARGEESRRNDVREILGLGQCKDFGFYLSKMHP